MKFVLELLKSEINRYEKSISELLVIYDATRDEDIQSSLLRDIEYLKQFKTAYDILLNSEQNPERSVATESDSSNVAGKQTETI